MKKVAGKISLRARYRVAAFVIVSFIAAAFAFNGLLGTAHAQRQKDRTAAPPASAAGTYTPTNRNIEAAAPINVAELAEQEALAPSQALPTEIRSIDPPRGAPPKKEGRTVSPQAVERFAAEAPPPSATGPSPGPTKTFKGEFLTGTTIPPDTMGAVGTTHVVTVSNGSMSIQDRNGASLSRVTINSFWSGSTIKGNAVASAFDTKAYFDRFNNRFILVSSLNGPGANSGMGVAVTQTADPTGTWFRYTAASDPAGAATGHAIDYPTVGINKNWIVVDENTFNYSGANFTSYYGQQIFVFDKAAAYANTLGSASLFEGTFATCLASPTQNTELGCGFTMAPAITEDNTTNTDYLVEDWEVDAAQLRLSKLTGTPAAPVLTVGTQFPQSTLNWRVDASRIGTTNNCGGTCSGGYLPQRQQSAHLTSGARIMANDSRIQNAVLRNGTLWTTHTVMLAATPTPSGTAFGAANPDTHSGVQWWAINPTIEPASPIDPVTGLGTLPIQRGRIEDPTADNCHNGTGGTRAVGCTSTALQTGQFYAFPNISVNQNDDVLIGFSQFSNLTYASGAYAIRRSTDPVNTTRDPVVFRPGQANYNIGGGSGTARQDRWGDYSAAQTDPLDDTNFWTVQEYGGAQRDFGIGIAGPWETWWAQVNPAGTSPVTNGSLKISQFRLRGTQGVNDEFVEVFNPGSADVIVNTTDNSDGWALGYSTTAGVISGVAVIPNGTVIRAKGHFLIARNQDPAAGPTLVYGLNGYAGLTNPAATVRGADSDTGYALDLADNGGLALFKTSTVANFAAGTRMDSVGFASTPAGLFKEGTGIPDVSTAGIEETLVRKQTTGLPQDTDDNVSDFVFADTGGTLTTAGQRLGAPGPRNLDGPLQDIGATFTNALAAPCVGKDSQPNIVSTPGAPGTLVIRRKFTNTTGVPITRLRFRVVDISTFPTPNGVTSDLRIQSSSNGSVATPCGPNITVSGTTVEQPPTQAVGGGLNTSLTVPDVSTAAPLANNGSLNVAFNFNVFQQGTLRFCVVAETIPISASQLACVNGVIIGPTAAKVTVSGRVASPEGRAIKGVIVTIADQAGNVRRATSSALGFFRFDGVSIGSYVLGASSGQYDFASQFLQLNDNVNNISIVGEPKQRTVPTRVRNP